MINNEERIQNTPDSKYKEIFEVEKVIFERIDLSRNLEFSGGENPLKPVFSPPPL